MSEDDCKALFSKFKMLCRAYTQDDPENKVKEKAWMQLVKEFIHVEMKDPLELLNTFMMMMTCFRMKSFKPRLPCTPPLLGTGLPGRRWMTHRQTKPTTTRLTR
jgi:hypothetical protein